MQPSEGRLPLTPEGQRELCLEIACLEQTYRDIRTGLKREHGDPRNPISEELETIEEQICLLRLALDGGVLLANTGLVVAVGSRVTVVGEKVEETLTIGGPMAANPRFGCISYQSHLARALLGRELGDTVEITSREGTRRLKIVAIRRGRPGAWQGQG